MPGTPLAPGVIAEAVGLYEAGMTSREVAAEMTARGTPVDPTSVTRWAPPRRRGPRGRDDIDEWWLLALHLSGLGHAEIARRMKMPRTTVRNRLAAMYGHPRPSRTGGAFLDTSPPRG